ncbi:MAG: Flp pilus assembly complex ATPase component TadA [Deltaproteobacteria bacterium]|nr:Flp pilus assembly complex ATPase component TadA [Deltaproteobacteria bacterium]
MGKRKKIGEILKSNGLVNEAQVKEALKLTKDKSMRTGEALTQLGHISEKDFASAISEQYGLKTVDLKSVTLSERAMGIVPVEMLHKGKMVVIEREGKNLIVTSDPTEILLLDQVQRLIKSKLGRSPKLAVAPPKEIEKALKGGETVKRMLKEVENGFDLKSLKVDEEEGEEGVLSVEKLTQDASPVVKLIDTTIYDALNKHASDIHLESTPEGLVVKYRLDGVLHKIMGPVEKQFMASIISRVKVMSELDIAERRIPQDGRFKIKFKDKAIDFRVSIMPGIHGEDAVIRVLDKEHITNEMRDLSLDTLGFDDEELVTLRRLIKEPYGMFLVTGPTGSGKTTTLYAAVSEINTGEDKILTIEDPVEYELAGVIQVPVNEKKGLTFAKGLRSALRHDPDKIMVGEIRDSETAEIAIQAALTGHLVFTTVHANNVFDVIGRFVHMGIEPYNFVSSLNCVIAQRLIRLVCPECTEKRKAGEELLRDSALDLKKYATHEFSFGAGCENCFHTGYKGRKAIVEILELNDELRDAIAGKAVPSEIKKIAYATGMKSLREAAMKAALSGLTTLEEINRVTFID